jgi:transposase
MKRKRYSQDFRMQVVKEALETGNASLVARRYEIHNGVVNRWVREYQDQSGSSTTNNLSEPLQTKAELKKITQENDQLKKLLGEKELEIQILRDLLKKTNPHSLTKLK